MKTRAKTPGGEVVEGYYYEDKRSTTYTIHCIQNVKKASSGYKVFDNHLIDEKTLEYKIGDEWFSMEELEIMKLLYEPYVKSTDRAVKMSKDEFGAYMDWSMQNGYR